MDEGELLISPLERTQARRNAVDPDARFHELIRH